VVVLVALIGGGVAAAVLHTPSGGDPAVTSLDGTRHVEVPVPATVRPADPFAGSPAATYPDGAAGIVPPAAKKAGPFSAAQVGAALTRAKAYLVAVDLDPGTLRGNPTASIVTLLEPDSRKLVLDSVASPSKKNDPVTIMTRFPPREAVLATGTIKVHGTMSYRVVKGNQLVVHLDYVAVYAVRPPTRDETTRVIVRRVIELSTWSDGRIPAGTFWLGVTTSYSGNVRCTPDDGWLHPDFPSGRTGRPGPSGPVHDPYDQSRDPRGEADCGTVSRI
jgi:hypothetical protein